MGCKMAKLRNKKHPSADEPLDLTKQDIEQLKRKELQAYCKKYGIKANGKTAELQEQLIKLSLTYQTGIDENGNEIKEGNATGESSANNHKSLTEKSSKSKKVRGKNSKTSRKEKAEENYGTSKQSSDEQQEELETHVEDKVEILNKNEENKGIVDIIKENVHHDDSELKEEHVESIVSGENLHDSCDLETNHLEDHYEDQSPSSSTEHEGHIEEDHGGDYVASQDENSNMSPKNTPNSSVNLHNQTDLLACHTTSSYQDSDSIYGEIISNETLNATFNLDKTYVKSNKLTTPFSRARNATFILQRQSVDDEDITGCDSTSTAEEEKINHSSQKSTALSPRWCVVEGTVKNDRDASWRLIKLKGGRPVVPNTFGKYIQFVLEPSQRDVPEEFRDNFICGSCAKKNEKAFCESSASTSLNSRASEGISRKDKENSSTPLTSFERNTVRASIKRKRVEEQATCQQEESETHIIKRQKKSGANSFYNRNPASPMMRKARGEAIELPRNHKNPWRPKVPSRSITPVNVTEDASYAEKVEAIIQNTIPGSQEELRLIMTQKSRVQRSPTKT